MTHNYAKKFAVTIKHVQARRLGEDIADMSHPPADLFSFWPSKLQIFVHVSHPP